ncbi:MAG: NIL domain-containing protein [Candidatus Omnitrophica bacterium]|nr:NIL domain-containing protein [Candidatus Omnitrophota bacterium]
MAKKAFHLIFPQELIQEPIMFLVARDNNLTLNIRRAKITKVAGEATIELEGKPDDLAKAERVFKERGVRVENVLGDVIE